MNISEANHKAMPLDLTIAIPVQNEEDNLAKCLAAIGNDLARQIVVIDSGSVDKTVAIANAYGAQVINFEWNGKFPKKRNWYLRNYKPTTKWILFLDADEFLTKTFKIELRKTLQQNDDVVGYWLNYTVYFLGKKNKGGYFLKKLALFQIAAGEYEKIDEDHWSKLDMEIHEHPVLQGKVKTIRSKIDHQDFKGIPYYIKKHNEYSDWEAARYMRLVNDSKVVQHWSWMQKIKYSLMRTPLLSLFYFFGSYFFMGGFRDGSRGLTFAILKMAYFNQIYLKIQEAMKNENTNKLKKETKIQSIKLEPTYK